MTARGHEGAVTTLAFSPDGSRLGSGSADGTIRIWEASSAEELVKLLGHTGEIASIDFSSDGTRLVSMSVSGSVRLWDAVDSAARFRQKEGS